MTPSSYPLVYTCALQYPCAHACTHICACSQTQININRKAAYYVGAAGLQGTVVQGAVEEESRPLVGGLWRKRAAHWWSVVEERSLLVDCEGRELLIGGLWRKSPNGGLWRRRAAHWKRAAPLVACYFIMNFLDLQNKPGVMAHICKHQHLGG